MEGELDYRLLFEQSPHVLLVLRPDAPRYTMVAATRSRFEITRTGPETIGRGLFDVFPDSPAGARVTAMERLRASLERVLATRAPDTMAVQTYEIRGPDGTSQARYWSPKNVPILSPSGEILYILHCIEDVTDLVRANEVGDELTARNREMEREVVSRSRELVSVRAHLQMQRLRQGWARKVESANRDLEAFSYSVAHDLRAPLRAIDGFSRSLLETQAARLDDEGRRDLERVRAATTRMAALIEDLLSLARVTLAPVQRERVDVTQLAREIARVLQERSPGRAVTVDVADGLVVEADPRLLTVVLENLLGNAWKFTSKRATARISVGQGTRGGDNVLFVRDNGAGFDMQYASRLFVPFQRLHSAAEFEGTGIGLATVRRIVDRHNGRIWAEGRANEGATFFLALHPLG
jgi:signal transduction histidine kinase